MVKNHLQKDTTPIYHYFRGIIYAIDPPPSLPICPTIFEN